jgi:glutathione S-transferase
VSLQEGVSVADIVLWSVLFLLATGAKHQQELLSEQSHVQRWFSHLGVQPEVQVW